MKKVHISFLHNLGHVEFKTFYSSLLRLMQEQQFADLALTELFERLQNHHEDVESLKRGAMRYKNTNKISELSRLRTDYLTSFRLEVKSKMLWYKPEVRVAAERLYKWLKHYKKEPFIQSISTQDKVVDNMLWRIEKDKYLRADITLLGLDKLMDVIDKTTQQIAEQVKQRDGEKVSRQKKGRDIRNAAYTEVKTLANYLEYKVSLIHGNAGESEHYILLLEMHRRLKDIRKTFRIRTAKDKTRREKEALKNLSKLESAKEIDMKQHEIIEQTPQAKHSTTILTETEKELSSRETMTQKSIESPKTQHKQKSVKAKTKMNRRKIKKLLG